MQLSVIKIGGNIIDDPQKLSAFLQAFADVKGLKILVHGGGKIASDLGRKMGIEPHMINGRRITDEATLSLVTMVYGGLLNKNIVAKLQTRGCNAIGLTGADGALIPAVKRPVADIDYGFVGDVESTRINAALLKKLLLAGLTPVFAPLTFDGAGNMLNTNADTVAQELAKALAPHMPVQLIYCFEKKGVLIDAADDESVINSITERDFTELKDNGIVSGGMIPKLENAFAAINQGVEEVIIGQAEELPFLLNGSSGTSIKK